MQILVLILILMAPLCASSYSMEDKPEGVIYLDSSDKRGKLDTTIVYFGATIPNIPLHKIFFIENLTPSLGTLWIENPSLDPNFVIKRPPEDKEGQIKYSEFKANFNRSVAIELPADTILKPLPVMFSSDSLNGNFPEGRISAIMEVTLKPKGKQETAGHRIFRLVADKLKHALSTAMPEERLNFDSVYMQSQPLVRPWVVSNDISHQVVETQGAISYLSSDTTEFSFVGNTPPGFPEGPGKLHPADMSYSPQNEGPDSAIAYIHYSFSKEFPKAEPDTLQLKLRGFGVFQKLDLDSVNTVSTISNVRTLRTITDSQDTKDEGDIIDLGDVALNQKLILTMNFVNNGNMRFGSLSNQISNMQSNVFTVEEDFPQAMQRAIPVAGSGSVRISFVPNSQGVFTADYIINSDIADTSRRRVFQAPPEAKQRIIHLRGRGVRAVLEAESPFTFQDSVTVLPKCRNSSVDTVIIINKGNIPLSIDSWRIYSKAASFQIISSPPEEPVNPNEPVRAAIMFEPKFTLSDRDSVIEDALVIYSTGGDSTIIGLKAVATVPRTILLAAPASLSARPGNQVVVPVLTNRSMVVRAQNFRTFMSYDTSLMIYNSYTTQNTASGNANVQITDEGGLLEISASSGFHFSQSDTLMLLVFDTYLGTKLSGNILMQSSRLGNADCDSIFVIQSEGGTFSLDSLCGLQYKVLSGNGKFFRLGQSNPNPARSQTEIEYEIPYSAQVRMRLFNSYGEEVFDAVNNYFPAGSYRITLPTAQLVPGVYFCEMQAGLFRAVQTILVAQP